MAKVTKQEQEQELLDFLGSTKAQSGIFRFTEGKTAFFPVYEQGTSWISAFGKTVNFWNGEAKDRWVFYALLAMAEDAESLPDGYEEKLIPVFIPKTLAHSIAKKLKSDDFNDGAAFTTIAADGTIDLGDMFIVERATEGKRTTYEVSIASKTPDGLPATLPVPELSIQDFAMSNKEQMEKRNIEYLADNSKPSGNGTEKQAANDFAGFA